MAAKNSNEMYASVKKKRIGFMVGKWMSIITPFIVVGAINFNDYFTEVNGVKVSFGCMLAMLVAGVSIYNESRNSEKRISGLVGWAIAIALVWLLNSILQDLLIILLAGFAGQLVGKGFDIAYETQNDLYKIYKNATINAQANAEAFNNKQ